MVIIIDISETQSLAVVIKLDGFLKYLIQIVH